MTKQFTTLPLNESHLKAAAEIYNHYVLTSTATFDEREVPLDEFRYHVFFEDERHGSFVVIDKSSDSVVGFATLGPYKSRSAYRITAEVSLYFLDEYTGRDLGKLLIEKVHNFATLQGFHALVAGICTETEASIKLFEKMGYEKVAHFKEVGLKFDRILDIAYYEIIIG